MLTGRTCATCAFWNEGGASVATLTRDPSPVNGIGTCEARPPVPTVLDAALKPSLYPMVRADRGCGLWRAIADAGPSGGEEISNIIPLRTAA